MHIHSHALHNLGEIVKLDKLVGIGVADDPNVPGGFEELEKIRAITGDIPLQIECSAQQLQKGMQNRTLPGNVMYVVNQGVETIDQANRLMDEARAYRSVE